MEPTFKFIFADKDDDDVLGVYSKHFRGEKLVTMQKASPLSIPSDVLILPLPSAFGLLPTQFIFREIAKCAIHKIKEAALGSRF